MLIRENTLTVPLGSRVVDPLMLWVLDPFIVAVAGPFCAAAEGGGFCWDLGVGVFSLVPFSLKCFFLHFFFFFGGPASPLALK